MAVQYQQAKTDPKPFYHPYPGVGLEAYHFFPLSIQPNFDDEYLKMHNLCSSDLSKPDAYILKSFTQQYIRTLEQAVHSYCNPTY